MTLVDSHCHLQDKRLEPVLENAIQSAKTTGVEYFYCCGTSESDWAGVQELSEKHPEIIASFGLHPWFVTDASETWKETLLKYLDSGRAAIGETGLDFALKDGKEALREKAFIFQYELATFKELPVSIHCRKAWNRLPELLEKHLPRHPAGFLIHSYSGPRDLVQKLSSLGGYFSFSGSITYPNNKRAIKTIPEIPRDRLLIETDAPDIRPHIPGSAHPDNQNAINEPENLVHVLHRMAEILNIQPEELARQTTENAKRLFTSLID